MGFFGNLFGKRHTSSEGFPEASHDISDDSFSNDPLKENAGGMPGSSLVYEGNHGYGSSDETGLPPPSYGRQQYQNPDYSKQSHENIDQSQMQVRDLPPNYGPQQFQQPHSQDQKDSSMMEKNIEIISSKLDALRAVVESMDNRLRNIERIAEQSDAPKTQRPKW